MSAAEASVQRRLIAILSELPAIGKNQKNTQQGFMFRGHDDILNALNPLLSLHGVIVVPDVLERVTAQRTTAKGSVMYEVNLHVRFRFYGVEGDFIEASTWGEGTDSGDKATNKAMTMAFKNVLNQTFAISSAEFKDSDAETPEETRGRQGDGKDGQTKPAAEREVVDGQIKQLTELLEALELGFPHNDPDRTWTTEAQSYCLEKFEKNSVAVLSKTEMNQLIEAAESWLVQQQAEKDIPFG